MATSATTYFGNRSRCAVVATGAAAPSTLAQLFTVDRGFEATFSWENAELYGTDSIFRVDEARHTSKNQAKLKGCKFDPSVSSPTGIFSHILNALNGATASGGVVTNAGAGLLADSNNQYLMDVYIWGAGSVTPTTNVFCLKVKEAYFESIPFVFPENDFMILDLTFNGRSGQVYNNIPIPTS